MFDECAGEFLATEENTGVVLSERGQTDIGRLGSAPFPVLRSGPRRSVRAVARVSRPSPDLLPFPLVTAAGTDVGEGGGQAGQFPSRRGRGQGRDRVVRVPCEVPVGGTARLFPQLP